MNPTYSTIAVLPWLNLKSPVEILGVVFTPHLEETGTFSELTKPISKKVNPILKNLRALGKERRRNCVIAFIKKNGELDWKIDSGDHEKVKKASLFLYLTALSSNEYFRQLRTYTNSSYFRFFFQNIPNQEQGHVAFEIRTRGGGILAGGIKVSEAHILAPMQCYDEGVEKIDENLVASINIIENENKEIFDRIQLSLNYFSMAHTDDEFMGDLPDITFMASAFEALFNTYKAQAISKKLGEMFLSYGSEKVKVALNSRSGISLETGLEKEQEELFVHQIWIKELHNLRSKLIHAEPITNRTWGWSPSEHLIIGTFIYPLIIKLTLQKAGAYTMTYEDEGNCFAIDKLLVENKWSRIVEGNSTAWSRIIFHSTLRAGFSANRRLLSR